MDLLPTSISKRIPSVQSRPSKKIKSVNKHSQTIPNTKVVGSKTNSTVMEQKQTRTLSREMDIGRMAKESNGHRRFRLAKKLHGTDQTRKLFDKDLKYKNDFSL